MKAVNKLLADKNEIINNFESIKNILYDTSSSKTEQAELQREMEIVAEMIQQCIYENANVALDQTEYQNRYDSLVQRFESAKLNLEIVTEQIKRKTASLKTIEAFLSDLQKQKELLTDFDPLLWHSLVDFVSVYEKDDVRFTFKNGLEIHL